MDLISILREALENYNYSKFPLSSLFKQAVNFPNFKDFSHFYSLEIYHGYYWHLTDNPNFKLSSDIGPRDMSSMASGMPGEKGAMMITSDLANWDAHYNTLPFDTKRDVKRNYVVLFDPSDIEPKYLQQVGRGFGNEVYLDSTQAKKLKQIGVYNLKYAKALDRKFHKTIPQTEEELYKIWKDANNKK